MFSAGEIYDLAIRIEENGETFYRGNLEVVKDASVRKLLVRLADDEREHRKFFAMLKAAWQDEEEPEPMDEMSGGMLQELLGRRTFCLDEVDMPRVEDERELLGHALEFEQDTILFYEMIQGFVTDESTLARMERVIEEERGHVGHLKRLLAAYEAA